jgi:choline monooxygenase
MFAKEHYMNVRRPLQQASTLPGWCYVSPDWYQREVETIFSKDWLCVGRVEQIPKPGDFFSIEVVGQPLIVVRDEAGQVRVHSAVCRHRGAVITENAGHCRAFVCPYHNWTYSLSGKLVSTPGQPNPMAGVEGFSCADYGLTSIRAETWAGFVFINFDEKAPSLVSWLSDLPDFLAEYGLENMVWQHCDVYDIDCNWKVWLENALEPYHANFVHRKHMEQPQTWTYERTRGP